MSSKSVMVITLLLAVSYTSVALASEASDYIDPGREAMFEGTLSGLRTAYYLFDDGVNDAGCTDCDGNRELRFLHALTHSYMLLIRDGGGEIDSAFELAREFGINIEGDSFFPFALKLDTIPLNDHGNYEIPEGAPGAEQIREILDTQTIPELGEIIAELELITDEAGDRFQVFFVPEETGLRENLEVDYGDVLILKGLLTAAKGLMEAESAYDIFIDPNDMIAEKIYGDSFHVNEDLLNPYPDLLKVLPTEGHPEDGAALLALARQDLLDSIDYYFEAIAYIQSEEDEQENDLFYIDTCSNEAIDIINEKLVLIKNSLLDDTSITHPIETIDTYGIQDTDLNDRGEMTLAYNPLDLGEGGQLTLIDEHGLPRVWKIGDFEILENELFAEMELDTEKELPYTGYHNLSHANSLLFEPDGDTSYICTLLDESLFTVTGAAQGWHAVDTSWEYTMPFAFDFYGITYTNVYVCSNGYLDFASSVAESDYYWRLFQNVRIAPLWESYLSTESPYDIYIDDTIADQVTFHWHTIRNYYGGEFNFSVTLYSDGRIRFDYGSNTWNGQVIGISRGNNSDYVLVGGGWGQGLLTADFNPDHTRFGNAVVEYWGNVDGTIENLWGEHQSQTSKTKELDLNPIFGNTPRYPNPVALRDLLPEFDYYNAPLPWTVGQGLIDNNESANFAASLGGILTGMTQLDWITQFNMQPSYDILLQEVTPLQLIPIDGNWFVNFWWQHQVVVNDIEGDTDDVVSAAQGVDIQGLCLGYDFNNLYGCILLHDEIDLHNGGENNYELCLSYVPDNPSAIGTIRFMLYVYDGQASLELYYKVDDGWWSYWEWIDSFSAWVTDEKTIGFFVPWLSMPASLPGRFLSLDSQGWDSDWFEKNGENNHTHIQIAGWEGMLAMTTVSGHITYEGEWLGGPIYVQAYTDPEDPGDSLVASTMLEEPGDYTLTGIGLGFDGYIRAYASVYGLNPFAGESPIVEDIKSVNVSQENITGIDFLLTIWHDYCGMAVPLALNTPYNGSTIGATGSDITRCGCNDDYDVWHRFTAPSDGVYQFDLVGIGDFEDEARLAIFDGCGGNELLCHRPCESNYAYLNVQGGQDYLIRVAGAYYSTGPYSLTVTYFGEPVVNDFCENAVVIDPNITYAGTTVGASGTDITERAGDDAYDVWYSFTPEINATYQAHRLATGGFELSTHNSTSVAVFDSCGGNEITFARPRDPNLYFFGRTDSTYLIRIAGSHWGTGTFELTVSPYSDYIFNDLCENAIIVEPNETYFGTTIGAGGTDITSCACWDDFDVWYKFIPDLGGVYRLELIGLDDFANNARLAIFEGCSQEEILCHQPCTSEFAYINAQAGREYLIRIAGRDRETGEFTLAVVYERPSLHHDQWTNAVNIQTNVPYSDTTEGATGNDITSCACGDVFDVWHRFTPQHSGVYRIELESEFDARTAIFEMGYPVWLGKIEETTCCRPCEPGSFLFQAQVGATYYIRVAGSDGETGPYTITCTKPFTADMNEDGRIDVLDLEQLLSYWLESNCLSMQWCEGADMDFSDDVDLGDYAIFIQYWLEGTEH